MRTIHTMARAYVCRINLFVDLTRLVMRFITWFELSRVKLYRNDLKENKNYLELAGMFLHYSKSEKEIQIEPMFQRLQRHASEPLKSLLVCFQTTWAL